MTDYSKSSEKSGPAEGQPDKPRPEIQKVVTGEVVVPKKTLGQKFTETFLDKDFFKGLVHHTYRDIIVPNAKHIMFDTGKEILLGTIYRNGNLRQTLTPQNIVSKITTNYQTPVQRPGGFPSSGWPSQPMGMMPQPQAIEMGSRAQPNREGKVFLVAVRKEAEDVLESMSEIINSQYKFVSLLEVKEMLGMETTPADNNWGWFSLGNASIEPHRDGYLLKLPHPEGL